jgi:hypothetical protein
VSPSSQIVQKLWNYCNVLPACRALLGAGGRDDLSACGAQAGGMSYGDYHSAKLRTGVEQLTHLLFLKMADERAAWSVSFQLDGFSSVPKWAIMRSCEVGHG